MTQRLLIYRMGHLGDSLATLPALWVLREHFPRARITLLSDLDATGQRVAMRDTLAGAGLIDDFIGYPRSITHFNWLEKATKLGRLLIRLRRQKFDALAYLVPTRRPAALRRRDLRFFRLTGIRQIYGERGFIELPTKQPGQALPAIAPEADLLLDRLRASGLPAPSAAEGRMDLNLNKDDQAAVDHWLSTQGSDGGRRWIGVGPSSKMPAKIWPEERYAQVLEQLVARFDVWPVIFGGPADTPTGERLLARLGRGYNAAGALSIRASAAALGRAALYLGNDTGTMHLAAAAGTQCVALFSARDLPGLWHPYGPGHRVFRSQIECEGCMLIACVERDKECLRRIMPGPVVEACAEVLYHDA